MQMDVRMNERYESWVGGLDGASKRARSSGLRPRLLFLGIILFEPVKAGRTTAAPPNRDIAHVAAPLLRRWLRHCRRCGFERRLRNPLEPLDGGSVKHARVSGMGRRATNVGQGVERSGRRRCGGVRGGREGRRSREVTGAEEGHGGDGVGSSVRENGEEDVVQARWEDLSQIVGRVKMLDERLGEFCRRADRFEELPDADFFERRQSKVHLERSQHSSPPSTWLSCSGQVLRSCLGCGVERGCWGARGRGQPRIRVQVQDCEVVEVQDLGGEEFELVAREVQGVQRGEPPDPFRERVEAVLPQGQDVQVRKGPERVRDGVDGDVVVAQVQLDGHCGRRRGGRKGRCWAE